MHYRLADCRNQILLVGGMIALAFIGRNLLPLEESYAPLLRARTGVALLGPVLAAACTAAQPQLGRDAHAAVARHPVLVQHVPFWALLGAGTAGLSASGLLLNEATAAAAIVAAGALALLATSFMSPVLVGFTALVWCLVSAQFGASRPEVFLLMADEWSPEANVALAVAVVATILHIRFATTLSTLSGRPLGRH